MKVETVVMGSRQYRNAETQGSGREIDICSRRWGSGEQLIEILCLSVSIVFSTDSSSYPQSLVPSLIYKTAIDVSELSNTHTAKPHCTAPLDHIIPAF